ncbi:MAG: alpha/beta fold hydrolase [Desulfobacterales bacterium]
MVGAPAIRTGTRGSSRPAGFFGSAEFEALYPFASHFANVRGRQYHYLDEGKGDPVVLLHGNPTWSFYFRSLVGALREHYRVIAPDHIGCGLSEKPRKTGYGFRLEDRAADLEAFLDGMRLKDRLTLVLHDWGGMIGLVYATRHPERVGRLVVTNTSGFLPPAGKPIPKRLRLIRNLAWFGVPAVLGFNLFARGALVMAPRKRLDPEVRKGLIAPYDRPRNRTATLRFVQDIPLRPGDPGYSIVRETDRRLHLLAQVPTLICWGMRDFVFDRDYYNEWRRRFPTSRCRVFPDAGHYLLEDEPEAVCRETIDFLEQHPLCP